MVDGLLFSLGWLKINVYKGPPIDAEPYSLNAPLKQVKPQRLSHAPYPVNWHPSHPRGALTRTAAPTTTLAIGRPTIV